MSQPWNSRISAIFERDGNHVYHVSAGTEREYMTSINSAYYHGKAETSAFHEYHVKLPPYRSMSISSTSANKTMQYVCGCRCFMAYRRFSEEISKTVTLHREEPAESPFIAGAADIGDWTPS